nr:D-alanyl-D-alanine carboxypeptidase family protein [Paenibacillus wynnii]
MKIKKRKRIFSLMLCMLLFLLLPMPSLGAENSSINTHARAASLIDVESGRILYSSRGDEPMPMASLTKIMTAIVAIENGDLDGIVKVSKNAYAKEGSSLYLKLGEEMTLETMLYGLMLRSGNDAASAIAEHVGGSEEGFVFMMNAKAELLQLKNTHFANPHGLDAKGHYSSANDLAVLTAYALHNPVFKEIVKTEVKTADNPNEKWDYKWRNKNKMLRLYEGADGVKTGYTKIALRCLVSSATRNGQQLVAVTLNDGNDWNDHASLLNFGFNHYPLKTLIKRGDKVSGYDLFTSKDFNYPLGKGEQERLITTMILHSESKSGKSKLRPVDFGLQGFLQLQLGGKEIGRIPLYAPDTLPPKTPIYNKKISTEPTVAYPSNTWLQAAVSTLRALFQAGGRETYHD